MSEAPSSERAEVYFDEGHPYLRVRLTDEEREKLGGPHSPAVVEGGIYDEKRGIITFATRVKGKFVGMVLAEKPELIPFVEHMGLFGAD